MDRLRLQLTLVTVIATLIPIAVVGTGCGVTAEELEVRLNAGDVHGFEYLRSGKYVVYEDGSREALCVDRATVKELIESCGEPCDGIVFILE